MVRRILLCGLAAVFLVCPTVRAKPPEPDPAKRDELYRKLDILAESLNLVLQNYVEEVKPDDLVYGAIDGMLQRLDPHSGFMAPKVFGEEQEEMMGSFEGVGLEVAIKDGKLLIVTPIEDGPAYIAGVRAGDEIIFIGDDPASEMDFEAALKKLRGPKGSKVTIRVRRDAEMELRTMVITRDVIKMKSVKQRRIGTVGLVRITRFQRETHVEVADALKKLSEGGPLTGLVLDLRNNPGGLLDQAVKVSDLFLKDGVVVSTRGRDPEQDVIYKARDDGDEPGYPMVVLTNQGTASAAEIVSGALQDHKRALLIGERTFGKGSVQTLFPMSDGSGIRITSALYYTPSDRSIQAKGIVPDMVVAEAPMMPSGQAAPRDPMHGLRREEDLKGHFGTPGNNGGTNGETPPEGKEPPATKEKDSKDSKGMDSKDSKEGEESKPDGKPADKEIKLSIDPQLERAVQILNGWNLFREIDKTLPAKSVKPAEAGPAEAAPAEAAPAK